MVKQALAAIVGSLVLGGCLTDPNIVYVPQTQQEEPDQHEDSSGDAALWPTDSSPAQWGVPRGHPAFSVWEQGTLLAQSGPHGAPDAVPAAALIPALLDAPVKNQPAA